MDCRLAGGKTLSEPMLEYFHSNIRNKLQRNLNWNLYIFIQETAFENVVSKTAAILSWPQCVMSGFNFWSCSIESPCPFMASDWLKSFHIFADKPLIRLISNLVDEFFMGFTRPEGPCQNWLTFRNTAESQLWFAPTLIYPQQVTCIHWCFAIDMFCVFR